MDSTSSDKQLFWNSFLSSIEERVNEQSFNTWFKPLLLHELTDDFLTISVPQPYFLSWLEEHYLTLLNSVSSTLLKRSILVRFVVGDSAEQPDSAKSPTPPLSVNSPSDTQKNTRTDNFDKGFFINPRFTFDSFIVGPSNQFAYVAAKAVSDAPGETAFNPLVIYGGVGLGKTHILQAIAHRYLSSKNNDDPGKNIIFVSSEKFTMDFILSIQKNMTTQHSQYYRTTDLLLVDDIQFFNNKERTQEEFFHIFNELHQRGKQIVLTMDCPPSQLKGLADRLINRFQWGLVTDIQPPDFETRVAILKNKAEVDGVYLDNSIAEFIAENITSNIRELEGSLIRLLAYSSLHGIDISLDMVSNILGDTIRKTNKPITIESIQKLIADHFMIPVEQIIGSSRRQEVNEARQIAMYLCKQLTSSSLKTIGINFGGRDHSTVIHSINKVESMIKNDTTFSNTIQTLSNHIKT